MFSLRTSHLTIMAFGLFMAQPVLATETLSAGDDGFGSSFFSAEAPVALQDSNNDADFWAEQLSVIEPAAGEDPFLLPPTSINNTSDRLDAPSKPLVPGMTADGETAGDDHPVLP